MTCSLKVFRRIDAERHGIDDSDINAHAEGKGAQHILGLESFDLVISDIRMPFMDGVELLKWVKANTSIPVILITGFSEILETAEAYRLGASDFLLKPFRSEDILRSIDKAVNKDAALEPQEDVDRQYCRIPLSGFVTGSQIQGAKIDDVLPVTVLDAQDIETTGATTGDELFRSIPQAGTVAFNEQNADTQNNARGDVASVNLRDLAFKDIHTTYDEQDGVTILVVQGSIVATGRSAVDVPRLRFAIQAANGHEIYAWTALPSRTKLAPGQALPFKSRLASPPEQGRSVKIRFFNRQDVASGLR